MTEKLLQALIMQRALVQLNHQVALPNDTSFYSWESDLLTINKSGYVSEFECKISRADYQRDGKKHKFLFFGESQDEKKNKVDRVVAEHSLSNYSFQPRIPNYFWYVTLDFDIDPPKHAGWLKVTYNEKRFWYDVQVMKVAPKLHSQKPPEHRVKIAARLLSFKLMSLYVNMHVRKKIVEVPKE
jgi:hypothetical protein